MGSMNTRILADPMKVMPITSQPDIMMGIWMGIGQRMPFLFRSCRMAAGNFVSLMLSVGGGIPSLCTKMRFFFGMHLGHSSHILLVGVQLALIWSLYVMPLALCLTDIKAQLSITLSSLVFLQLLLFCRLLVSCSLLFKVLVQMQEADTSLRAPQDTVLIFLGFTVIA